MALNNFENSLKPFLQKFNNKLHEVLGTEQIQYMRLRIVFRKKQLIKELLLYLRHEGSFSLKLTRIIDLGEYFN